MRLINAAAVKRYALRVSADRRAGKFTRVSKDFIDRIEASVEDRIRMARLCLPDPVPATEPLITGEAVRRFREALNEFTAAEVQRQVNLSRCGKTL